MIRVKFEEPESYRSKLKGFLWYSFLLVACFGMGYGVVNLLFAQTTEGFNDGYIDVSDPIIPRTFWDGLKEYINDQDSLTNIRTPTFLGNHPDEWGRTLLAVRNKSGGYLHAGDAVKWDTTRVVVGDTTKNKAMRVENDLSAEGGFHWILVVGDGTASDDSLLLYGLDEDGDAVAEVLVINDGADGLTKSAYKWTQVDSAEDGQAASGWDSYDVIAIPWCGVTSTSGTTYDFAGVVVGSVASAARIDSVADNGLGYICIYGVTQAYCDGNSTAIWPGDVLTLAAGGDMIPAAKMDSSYAGYTVARALEYQDADNTLTRVFVLP
ncbi:MAG: hypothetical protein P9M15_00910 [Candidatus Electryoneaceae bacterium]|nr:hypothetical protein [Candidatus Electryoneaceae bacterium]